MDIKKLLSGIAVIIDDEINNKDSKDLIIKIRDKLKNYNIPILEYEDIPENMEINNFINTSFILLDWELFDRRLAGSRTEEKYIKRNIAFIRKLRKITFAPIFIFSNQSPDSIILILEEKKLYKNNFNNYIFVKSKIDLFSVDRKRFLFWSKLMSWLKHTPSIYVLKEWEQSLNKAKRDLFWSFYDINHYWPAVLQETFKGDGSDVNYELGNFIFKNIMARTEPIVFDEDILKLEDDQITKKDIRKVLEAERFIKNDALPDIPFTGDLFEYTVEGSEEKRYYLNIRPECDIAIRSGGTSNPDLYCIKGRIVNEALINSSNGDKIIFEKGSFIEKPNNTYISFINDGKIIKLMFNEIKLKKWNSIKSTRIGRLLPPYITKVQQRYSFYLQRQGLPAIPEKAIE